VFYRFTLFRFQTTLGLLQCSSIKTKQLAVTVANVAIWQRTVNVANVALEFYQPEKTKKTPEKMKSVSTQIVVQRSSLCCNNLNCLKQHQQSTVNNQQSVLWCFVVLWCVIMCGVV
jgi:hypothetical protein